MIIDRDYLSSVAQEFLSDVRQRHCDGSRAESTMQGLMNLFLYKDEIAAIEDETNCKEDENRFLTIYSTLKEANAI